MGNARQPASRFQDQEYLRVHQYANPGNLEARIALHERFSTNPLGLHRWLFEVMLPKMDSARSILELGCGQGRLWTANADRVPVEWQLTLTDFSPGMLSASETNLAGMFEGRKQFAIVDAQSIPYPDASFDAVFAHFMLYHVPNRAAAYREIYRVLRPGGRLFAAALGKDHLRQIYEMAMRLDDTSRDHWSIPFRLDNGGGELGQVFEDVEMIPYEDGLVVTEEQPLVDYILSMVHVEESSLARLPGVRARIRAELAESGRIVIEKESGMFLCRKPVQ